MEPNKSICFKCCGQRQQWVRFDGIYWRTYREEYKWWWGMNYQWCDLEKMFSGIYEHEYKEDRDRMLAEKCPYYLEHLMIFESLENGLD